MPGYAVLLVDAESFEVYILQLRGTSAKVGRYMAAKGVLRKAAVWLSAEEITNDKGKFYVVKARAERLLEEADQSLIQGMYREDYAGVTIGTPEEMRDEETESSLTTEVGPDEVERVKAVLEAEAATMWGAKEEVHPEQRPLVPRETAEAQRVHDDHAEPPLWRPEDLPF
jgi:hypothetical protein